MIKFRAMNAEERRAYDEYVKSIAPVLLGKFQWEDLKTNTGIHAIVIGRIAGELIRQRRSEVRAQKE